MMAKGHAGAARNRPGARQDRAIGALSVRAEKVCQEAVLISVDLDDLPFPPVLIDPAGILHREPHTPVGRLVSQVLYG